MLLNNGAETYISHVGAGCRTSGGGKKPGIEFSHFRRETIEASFLTYLPKRTSFGSKIVIGTLPLRAAADEAASSVMVTRKFDVDAFLLLEGASYVENCTSCTRFRGSQSERAENRTEQN